MIQIIDNILPEDMFRTLYNTVTSDLFPWYFQSTIVYRDEELDYDGIHFCHTFYREGRPKSEWYKQFHSAVDYIAKKANIEYTSIGREMVTSLLHKKEPKTFLPHTDGIIPHKTIIFYFIDSDGETVIYNEKYIPDGSDRDPLKYASEEFNNKFTEKQRIQCIQNRAIIFDGLYYHSGIFPTNTYRRILLNANLI